MLGLDRRRRGCDRTAFVAIGQGVVLRLANDIAERRDDFVVTGHHSQLELAVLGLEDFPDVGFLLHKSPVWGLSHSTGFKNRHSGFSRNIDGV